MVRNDDLVVGSNAASSPTGTSGVGCGRKPRVQSVISDVAGDELNQNVNTKSKVNIGYGLS